MSKLLDTEKRAKIHKKAQAKCAEVCREVGADMAYMVVLISGGGGVHIVDAASGERIPNMPSLLKSLASAHENRDTDVSGADGWRQ